MDKALYDKGMAMRRKVLGDEYVDRAVTNTDDFNRKFQDMLNEFCWGLVWTDEDLSPRDRSLLNIGMIACLGRMHEFEAHFRGALRNGLTPKELAAALRQIAPRVRRTYGYINNHFAGHSPESARTLQRLLGQPAVEPDQLGEQFSLF